MFKWALDILKFHTLFLSKYNTSLMPGGDMIMYPLNTALSEKKEFTLKDQKLN